MKIDAKDYEIIKPYHHFIFWGTYFLINFIRWGSFFDDYAYSLKTNFIGFPIHIILTYINIYILLPKLIFQKKYISYIFILFTTIFLMVALKFSFTEIFVGDPWREGHEIETMTFSYVVNMMIGELYVITFVTAIKSTFEYIREHKIVNELEKANLETELQFLRSQISPHFFFNTLNNIYSLAIDKSDKTPSIILKLSEVMRYLLYESKSKKQSLSNEIICIQNYIDLEKLRHDDRCRVKLSIEGEVEDKSISPNILLTFIENAYKHSVRKNNSQKINIDISFKIVGDFLYFSVVNPTFVENNNFNNQSKGIGLENVVKRLKLGYNKESYELNFSENENTFKVDLKIKVVES